MEQRAEAPFFSVVIPFYNVDAAYFAPCMDSLLGQTFGGIEILIVDDGSGQEGAALCDGYARRDERIRVIHQSNQGVSAARNRGIREAAADWILFVDGDDWLERDACRILKETLERQDCDVLLFNIVKDYVSGPKTLNYGFKDGTLYSMDDPQVREMFYSRAMGAPNLKAGRFCVVSYSTDKAYRRSFLLENGLQFPVGIPKSEDKVFVLSCFEKMKSLYYTDAVLYHYRINEGSVCNRYSERADGDRKVLIDRLTPLARRMDKELGALRGDPAYAGISRQLDRFAFGIISDVLKLKFFHPDYPRSRQARDREVKAFLTGEPFGSALRNVRYSELPNDAKIKKFMLSHGLTSLFYRLKATRGSLAGKQAEKSRGTRE